MTAATTTATVADRVAAGAAWLDEHRPGWWQRTDLAQLRMWVSGGSPIGQEYGHVWRSPLGAYERWGQAVRLGFLRGDYEPPNVYNDLQREWRVLIEARRAELAEANR